MCRDKKITYLRKFGYNVISLPREGIHPLTVTFLGKNQQLTELGYLPEIWSSSKPVPDISPSEDVSAIGGQSTDKLGASTGLDILGNLVQALGADPISVKAHYESANTFEFHFKQVERERITAFKLGGYLAEGKLSSNNTFVKRYFQPSEKVYIVTEVLKSSGFGVTAKDSSDVGLDLKVPVIEEALSGEGSIEVSSMSQGTVEFSSRTKKLPFAFIAAELVCTDDKWEVVEFPDPGEIHLAVSDPQETDEFIQPWKGGSILFGNGPVDIAVPCNEE